MIAHLSGRVTAVGPTWVVLDVGGFGVKALCPPATAAAVHLDQPATLHTSLVVREDSLTLYGFAEVAERDCFELVQAVSGVGPKVAQAIISVLSPDALRAAVVTEDLLTLCRVPGIGRKGAQRLVIELKDKVAGLAGPGAAEPAPVVPGTPVWREQVAGGLEGLGWSAKEATAACDRVAVMVDDDPAVSVATLMRAALRSLAKQ